MRNLIPLNSPASLGRLPLRIFASLALLTAVFSGTPMLFAQTPAPASTAPHITAHKPVHPRKHPIAAKAQSPAAPLVATVVPATPAVPELPAWPVNEKPVPATVVWDSHGLHIDAENSSLLQIMNDVATATGATVEGLEADQRVFGVFGPGPARDVLSQLLVGSGYNVIMVGDQGQGTPRQIVLSFPHAGGAQVASNSTPATASDEDTDTEEPQPNQPGARPAYGPGGQPRTPEEMMQARQLAHQRGQNAGQPGNNPQN
ncbi:MAG: hypothetical protein ABR906_13960 [Terracidiphilus sp.]|jgi:hypothetical protein